MRDETSNTGSTVKPNMNEFMRIMDIASEVRKQREKAGKQFEVADVKKDLRKRLKATAEVTGEELSEAEIDTAINSYFKGLYRFKEPEKDFSNFLAKIYIRRMKFFKLALIPLALFSFVFFGVWSVGSSLENNKTKTKELALKEDKEALNNLFLSAQKNYDAIAALAKESVVKEHAKSLVEEAKVLEKAGDLNALNAGLSELDSIKKRLLEDYRVLIVSRSGVKSGVDRKFNNKVYDYFLVVEARDALNNVITRQIKNVEDGQSKKTKIWAESVSKAAFDSVKEDKLDNGIVNNNLFAIKKKGYIREEVLFPGVKNEGRSQITSW